MSTATSRVEFVEYIEVERALVDELLKTLPGRSPALANECVDLVSRQFGHQLDWSPESLTTLDQVCADLLADGRLSGERRDLWWRLIGAYTGEVTVRAYGGEWVEHETSRAPAVQALGVTGFPFALASRILSGEPYKSLASFVRVLPTIAERGESN